jgi:hypothetical protein
LSKPKYLLDVNVLIALAEPEHIHHHAAMAWFRTPGLDWGLCPFSEAGFLRIATNPKVGAHSIEDSVNVLSGLAMRPGYRFWPIMAGWTTLAAPFSDRAFGHQQITDGYLLGLAVMESGILVTFDGGIRHMAGPKYSKHVLVLEA